MIAYLALTMTWVQWVQILLLVCVIAAGIVAIVIRQRMGVRSRRWAAVFVATGEEPVQAGMRLFGQGRFEEAVAALEPAVGQHGELPDVRYALGVCLLHAGRPSHAWPHLEKAIRLDPVYLQYLVTRPETEGIREQPRFESFIRRQAKRFQDGHNQGYQ
jgi:tetratricopeptide (TPR) repeat protein